MDFIGILMNLDYFYVVRCFQKWKKIWRVQAEMKLCPIVVAQVSTSAFLECFYLGERKAEKTQKEKWGAWGFILISKQKY